MFCQVNNRALVVAGAGLHGQPLCAPWWRVLVGSALIRGASRWRVRHSTRSFSGAVVVVGFSNCGMAVAFAAAWAWYIGCSLQMRQRSHKGRAIWAVSVPVSWPGGKGSAAAASGGKSWWVTW